MLSLLYPEGYGTRSTTQLGVKVRSRAEQRIGDYFEQNDIRYKYEPTIETGLWIFTQKVSRPDFHLTEHDVYVEYWGMVNVQDERKRAQYVRSMEHKMARYHELGIKFISIHPEDMKNLDEIFRAKFRKATGNELFIKRA